MPLDGVVDGEDEVGHVVLDVQRAGLLEDPRPVREAEAAAGGKPRQDAGEEVIFNPRHCFVSRFDDSRLFL